MLLCNSSIAGRRWVNFASSLANERFYMRILGIETSCDETGIAVFDDEQGLMSHELYSQVKLHADYGGVVPELASRDHVRKIIPLIRKALKDANTSAAEINGVAYTQGPGLIGALLVGALTMPCAPKSLCK